MNSNSTSDFPINIYLLARNRLLREVIVRLFRKPKGATLAGASHERAQALKELAVTPCDVLLLDSLETLKAVEQRAEAAECLREIKVILFGMEEDPDCFFQAVRLGASGYLLKDASSMELIAAVRGVAQGEAICPPKLCKSLFEYVSNKFLLLHSEKVEQLGRPANDLTCRQRQLMTLVAKGMTNKEIAASLQLSEFTVKNHIHRIMAHLQADSRHAAVDAIRTAGLFVNAQGDNARDRLQTGAERQREFATLPKNSHLICVVSGMRG